MKSDERIVNMLMRKKLTVISIICAALFCLTACEKKSVEEEQIGYQEADIHTDNTEEDILQPASDESENVQENKPSEDAAESVEPFVDEELYLYIKGVYDEIDWDVQFLPGDESKCDLELYKERFLKLLEGEIVVANDSIWVDLHRDYDPKDYTYYFYDVDGDGTPELGVTDIHRFRCIFKYEEHEDRIVLWDVYLGPRGILGTGKFYQYSSKCYDYMGLDENGDYICWARFKGDGGKRYESAGDDGWAYFVALPDYMELEDWMLAQATYDDDEDAYFFRLTKEQYDELDEKSIEASYESHRKIEDVTYTYEELISLLSFPAIKSGS